MELKKRNDLNIMLKPASELGHLDQAKGQSLSTTLTTTTLDLKAKKPPRTISHSRRHLPLLTLVHFPSIPIIFPRMSLIPTGLLDSKCDRILAKLQGMRDRIHARGIIDVHPVVDGVDVRVELAEDRVERCGCSGDSCGRSTVVVLIGGGEPGLAMFRPWISFGGECRGCSRSMRTTTRRSRVPESVKDQEKGQ